MYLVPVRRPALIARTRWVGDGQGVKRELRVLFVEEDAGYAGLVAYEVNERERAVDLVHVRSVEAAIAALASATFDCLLLDTAVGGRAGLDVVQWLRVRDRPVPFLVLTADETASTAMRALRLGAREYVVKLSLIHI